MMKIDRDLYTLYILTHEEAEEMVKEKEGELYEAIEEHSGSMEWVAMLLGGDIYEYHEDYGVIKVPKTDEKRYKPYIEEVLQGKVVKVKNAKLKLLYKLYHGNASRYLFVNPETNDIYLISPRDKYAVIELFLREEDKFKRLHLVYHYGKKEYEVELKEVL